MDSNLFGNFNVVDQSHDSGVMLLTILIAIIPLLVQFPPPHCHSSITCGLPVPTILVLCRLVKTVQSVTIGTPIHQKTDRLVYPLDPVEFARLALGLARRFVCPGVRIRHHWGNLVLSELVCQKANVEHDVQLCIILNPRDHPDEGDVG